MVLARFAPILFVLARRRRAGRASGSRPPGLGTMRTDTPTFVALLIGVIVLVGALTFFPAILLGPVVQSLTTSAVLMRRDVDQLRSWRSSPSPSCFGLVYPLARDRRLAGRLPRQGERLEARAQRQARRLAAARAGLPQAQPGATSSRARRRTATKLQPGGHRVHQPRARTARTPATPSRPTSPDTSRSSGRYDPGLTARRVPVDAVTSSASGVDPQISQANAAIQAHRIAAVRRLPLARVRKLIADHTDGRFLGVLGEPGVNVLELNLALDRLDRHDRHRDPARQSPRASAARAR